MSVTINVSEGRGELPAPRPDGGQTRRVFWAKFFLCFVALSSLLNGSMASLVLIPAAAMMWAPTRRWMAQALANMQRQL